MSWRIVRRVCVRPSVRKLFHLNDISYLTPGPNLTKLGKNVPWVNVYKIPWKNWNPFENNFLGSKKRHFFNYLKIFLSKTACWILNLIWQKCSLGGPLPNSLKEFWSVKKHGRQGAWHFPLYVYKGNFENLLVKNRLLDFRFDLAEMFLEGPSTKFLERILIG